MSNSNTDPPKPQPWPPSKNQNDTYSDPSRSPYRILPPIKEVTDEARRNQNENDRQRGGRQ